MKPEDIEARFHRAIRAHRAKGRPVFMWDEEGIYEISPWDLALPEDREVPPAERTGWPPPLDDDQETHG